ncbi:transposase [Acidithiobacillus ferrivorans]|uniref:Transposase n=1 Tax=Acidithiobacillus ferrivorans TaxID=160808 RepID=A0ABY1MRZ6_9PROT|nr:IS66 family transposase [Acidithiobacillus ferrivorans]SMH66217.1 transposase [Acidithiobacillus ferrivorans]SMH66524.1 transposase [Acidithiobacillus ferrivorans]
MNPRTSTPIPTEPEALRDLVLSLLQTQQEKEAEWAERARYIAQQELAIALRDETIARLESTIAKLQRWRFGRRSEKLSPDQISLWEEALDTEIAAMKSILESVLEDSAAVTASRPGTEAPVAPARPPRRHPGRMQLPDTLPRVEVHHDPLTCTCGQCGGLLETVGEEISEKLDYIPGHFQVIRHIRPKLVCRPCGTIESPALPAQVIDKGLPTARMIAHVMTAKHVDHLPLYRQETQYLRAGVPISRATLCSWLGQGEYWISMLAEACKMALLEGAILHADETPLPVLNPGSGKTDKAYLWVYRSQADAPHPIVVFDYAPDRKGIHAQNFLGDWKGILQTDDYGGYDALYRKKQIIEAGCWAHVRRHFYDVEQRGPSPVAQKALAWIAKLYGIEADIKESPPDQKAEARQQRAGPLLESFRAWLSETQMQVAPKSGIAKAIAYALNRWKALTLYLEEGRLSIDNNPVERALRGVAIGRKNFLFVGNDAGGERAASFYSIIETCKLNGVEPFAYLCDVLEKLPTWPNKRLHELLPWNWKKTALA